MSTRYFEITSNDHVFYASLNKDGEFEMGNLDSDEGSCVQIEVHRRKKKADLGGVIFKPKCSENMPLSRKEGTVLLVKSALKAMYALFPAIEYYTLTDKSWFVCKERHVHLCDHHILLYGKTWYQRHFHAKVLSELTKKNLKRFAKKLSTRPTEEFADFWKHFDKLIRKSKLYTDIKDKIEVIQHSYERCSDWNDFFKRVHEKVGCYFYVPMLKHLLAYFGFGSFYGEKWSIPIESVEKWNMNDFEMKEISRPSKAAGKAFEGGKKSSRRIRQLIAFE